MPRIDQYPNRYKITARVGGQIRTAYRKAASAVLAAKFFERSSSLDMRILSVEEISEADYLRGSTAKRPKPLLSTIRAR